MSARALPTAGAGLLLVAASATCVPSLSSDDARVTATRILAIRAEPAEAAPGGKVTFTALVASPDGTRATADVVWSFCTAPKPLTEDNVVSNACLGAGGAAGGSGDAGLVSAGAGVTTTATTPHDGCSVFGPDVGSMGLRPRDPDTTGGYYQPLRAELPGTDAAFALARIRCDLGNASADAAAAFAKAYHANQNPKLLPVTATVQGTAAALSSIPRSAHVTLRASWPASSAETFAYFDPASQTVGSQREAMQIAWHASGGSLATESTGRAADDPATTSDVEWIAPDSPGTTHLWVVLRDSRGGLDFVSQALVTTR